MTKLRAGQKFEALPFRPTFESVPAVGTVPCMARCLTCEWIQWVDGDGHSTSRSVFNAARRHTEDRGHETRVETAQVRGYKPIPVHEDGDS